MASLFDAARACLDADTPEAKLALTAQAAADFAQGMFATLEDEREPDPIRMPGRPPRPRLVHPRELPRRGFGSNEGRAAFIHAVAHIEFNAIDLAWDAVYRFRTFPADYYRDWVGVAADEARHFAMLRERLREFGHDYGDFDAHNGLWEMAEKTAHDALARMALVPRVLEARGLDVTPGMIDKLRALGDDSDRRHPRRDPARRSRARRRGVALVSVVLRSARHRTARDVPRVAHRIRAPGAAWPVQSSARRAAGFDDEELASLQQLDDESKR